MIIYIRYSNAPPLIVMKLLYILRAQETVCHPKIINNRRFSQSKIHYKHYNTTTVAIYTHSVVEEQRQQWNDKLMYD